MATVRISTALIDQVKKYNKDKFEHIRNGLPKPRDAFDKHEVLLRAYDLITGGIRHTIENNPLSPYIRIDTVYIRTFSNGENQPGAIYSSSYASAEAELPVPASTITNEYGYIKSDGEIWLDATHPEWKDMYEEACRYASDQNQMLLQHQGAINQLQNLLKAHTTLAPALRAFPPLWDMLPQGIKDDHTRIDSRVRHNLPKTATDTSVLTQAVMTAKLLSGENNGQ